MNQLRTLKSLVRTAFATPGGVARAVGAAALVGTLAVQHPNSSFNRLALRDRFSLLPNWRFFAPTPAVHDFHLLYRTLDLQGRTSPWKTVDVIEGRKLHQIVWFPGRRPEKAVFDLCSDLLPVLDQGFTQTSKTPAYQVLAAYLRRCIRADGAPEVRGFQFALTQAAGFDTGHEPQIIFVSPYMEMASDQTGSPSASRQDRAQP
ncbi:hypothetical protein [Streptomyces bicolor]|uniref:hypothetical protein n=1 Tax=Streptomyces bicolor TaxID=66874 RepID=UPI0004E248AE|nr:hypothetical protein [Streptomyces bicolor]